MLYIFVGSYINAIKIFENLGRKSEMSTFYSEYKFEIYIT